MLFCLFYLFWPANVIFFIWRLLLLKSVTTVILFQTDITDFLEMEAKITFLTQVLWGNSVCSCVQSILYAGRYNPLTYGEQQQNQEQVIQFQNTLLCYAQL